MKEDDNEQAFRLHMTSLLRRLQAAGWITYFEEPEPDSDGEPVIEWNEDLKPLPGRANFYALASMLQSLCAAGPLNDDEQAMIQILRQMYFEE